MSRAIRRLLSEGQITRGEFEQATMLQAREGGTVGYYLIRLGAITDADLTEFLTRNFRAVFDYLILHGRGVLNTVIYCTLQILAALIEEIFKAIKQSPSFIDRLKGEIEKGVAGVDVQKGIGKITKEFIGLDGKVSGQPFPA